MKERIVFYEQAHFVCHANFDADELVTSIERYLSRFLKKSLMSTMIKNQFYTFRLSGI